MEKFGQVKIGGSYFATITAMDDTLLVTVVDSENSKIVLCYPIKMHFKSIKFFVNSIPKMFTNFKAVILHVFNFHTSEYPNMIEFRKAVKEKLESIPKPYHFMDEEEFILSYLIKSKMVNVKIGETIIYIHSCDEIEYGITEYLNTENGYKKIEDRRIPASSSSAIICKTILGSNNPTQIILQMEAETPATKLLQNVILKGKNITAFVAPEIYPKAMVDVGKWILNNKQPKLPVIPTCFLGISLGYEFGGTYAPLGVIKECDILPATKTFYTSKFMNDIVAVLHDDEGTPNQTLNKLPPLKQCHRKEFTLTMDEQNFPIYSVKNSIIDEICDLPIQFSKTVKSKIPIIGFCDNFSLIWIYKEDIKCYKCPDEWNGMFGRDVCISFDQKKPEYCEKAAEKFKTNPTSVVYDLVQIMSMPPDNIVECSQWDFKIIKDANNPVLLEFDSFDGTKKAASPAFLMALLLKEHMNVIKKETGEKPEILGFWLHDQFDTDEKKRIQNGLKEACDLLKIKCSFIDV